MGGSARLRLEVGGGYPFRETVTITLDLDRDARFPLRLRIPGWCERPSLSCNGEAVIFGEVDHGFVTVHQTWKDGDQLRLHLPMETRVLPRQTPAVSIERGPLVYALPIKEDWRPLRTRDRFSDWELHPASQWQYGIDETADLTPVESEIGRQPFEAAHAPIRLRTTGRLIPNWSMKHNSAAAPPLDCDVEGQTPSPSNSSPTAPPASASPKSPSSPRNPTPQPRRPVTNARVSAACRCTRDLSPHAKPADPSHPLPFRRRVIADMTGRRG